MPPSSPAVKGKRPFTKPPTSTVKLPYTGTPSTRSYVMWWGFKVSSKTAGTVYFSLLVLVLLAGIVVGRKSAVAPVKTETALVEEGAVPIRPGPWVDLEQFPMTIAAPEELLNVEEVEKTPVKWFFKGRTRIDLVKLFDDLQVPAAGREALFGSGSPIGSAQGVLLTPSREAVLALNSRALQGIYDQLGGLNENENSRWQILSQDLDSYGKSGISEKTTALLKNLSSPHGKFLLCYCMPYVLSAIPTHEEKVALLKAMTLQHTMLLKLHVTPQSDVYALTEYWGKAFWSNDVKALLESIRKFPNGNRLNILSLLPLLPKSLLYTYPMPQNPQLGPPVIKNCSWTAFNFFRDPPDPRFSDPNYVVERLKTDYRPLQTDPRFGDVMVLLSPDDELLHTAVYVADGIVYTKNGDNPVHPWMLSTLADLTDFFSVELPPGRNLKVQYFRDNHY